MKCFSPSLRVSQCTMSLPRSTSSAVDREMGSGGGGEFEIIERDVNGERGVSGKQPNEWLWRRRLASLYRSGIPRRRRDSKYLSGHTWSDIDENETQTQEECGPIKACNSNSHEQAMQLTGPERGFCLLIHLPDLVVFDWEENEAVSILLEQRLAGVCKWEAVEG